MLKSIQCADDTTLYLDNNPSTNHNTLFNSGLGQVQKWINAEGLSLNVQETNNGIISNMNQNLKHKYVLE